MNEKLPAPENDHSTRLASGLIDCLNCGRQGSMRVSLENKTSWDRQYPTCECGQMHGVEVRKGVIVDIFVACKPKNHVPTNR